MFRTPWASLPPPSPTGLSSPCWQIEEQPASTLPPTQHPITAAFEWGAGGQPAALAVPRGPGSIQQRVVVCRVGLPACNARFCISDAKNHPGLFCRPLSGSTAAARRAPWSPAPGEAGAPSGEPSVLPQQPSPFSKPSFQEPESSGSVLRPKMPRVCKDGLVLYGSTEGRVIPFSPRAGKRLSFGPAGPGLSALLRETTEPQIPRP